MVKNGGDYLLKSESFALDATPEEVTALAERFLGLLNGAAKIEEGDHVPVSIGRFERVNDEGQRVQIMCFQDECRVRERLEVGETDTSTGESSVKVPDRVVFRLALELSGSSESVQKVLRLWDSQGETWVNLYRVFEVVQSDIGGDIREQEGVKSREIDRFKHTANHQGATGDDARHGHLRAEPPKNPMPIEEARSLIRRIVKGWILSKSGAEEEVRQS